MKIVTVVGARPQFVKYAPLARALSGKPSLSALIVHTGQHYDENMNGVFFRELEIPTPDYNLEIGSNSHGKQTGEMLARIETVLLKERPNCVIVYGDTNSTLAGALAAAKLHTPTIHVEAGLRSYNRLMPEEINRVIADHISDVLFCPTKTAVSNLEKEGILRNVFLVGDVMYDAFLLNKDRAARKENILSDLGLTPHRYCLATVHRAENTSDRKRLFDLFAAFDSLAGADCPFIIPIHPRTLKALQEEKVGNRDNPYVRFIPPVGYLDMTVLEMYARVILTDSGGVQKEAYFAQVPCITLREETEWIETIETGWNQLAGSDPAIIRNTFEKATRTRPTPHRGLFGNGKASESILNHLLRYFDA